MITYKISKGAWSTYKNFNTIIEAQDWTYLNLGADYIVEISPDIQIEPPSKEEKFYLDKNFGLMLVDMFLVDNRMIEPAVTPSESLQLLSEFSDIEKLAALGDIKSVQILLGGIQTDIRLFTQERKDKYLNMITSYLQN
jgi:hypothetical protein